MTLNWPQFYRLSGDYLEMLIAALAEAKRDMETAGKLIKGGTKKRKFMIGNKPVWITQLREVIRQAKKEKEVRSPETMRALHEGMESRDNIKGFVKDLAAYEDAVRLRRADVPGRPEVVDVVMKTDIEKIRFA